LKLKLVTIIKKFLSNLPIAKLVHDTANLAMTCWRKGRSYLDTSKGSIFNVHRSDGFFAEVGW